MNQRLNQIKDWLYEWDFFIWKWAENKAWLIELVCLLVPSLSARSHSCSKSVIIIIKVINVPKARIHWIKKFLWSDLNRTNVIYIDNAILPKQIWSTSQNSEKILFFLAKNGIKSFTSNNNLFFRQRKYLFMNVNKEIH